ncbi:high affinity proline permease [Halobacteriovorax marinus SJ]|uniref:Sodium/proline symporter n=1 Tax=Halobacteriovorax marinus (strain ATCC BAA-682 / DSM 15412 / SJ) TaxID=862908 RepID=E1WX95_HALMS|nr:sodium/proline symporter [Halobacteriovorax marinus]CBW25796.1 high affinity proline permease [Halobacteriovorax marinus SJ]
MVVYSFLFFLLLFVLIGVSSTLKSKKNNSDYLMAGQDIKPWLAALSAVATNNSGYMFIGMIGYTYTSGLQSIWLMVGWIFGDYIVSNFVHKKLRVQAEEKNMLSFGGVLSRWYGEDFKKLRLLAGVITVLFLGVYAAAQFKAGSKALHVLFGWDYSTGAIIGSIIVFAYCLSGGLRASIWTDAAQSIVMIFAMAMLFFVGVSNTGGFSSYLSNLNSVAPGYLSVIPTGLAIDNSMGVFLFIVGWIFGGFGIIGQPHIMIRFMTINNSESMNKTRAYYYAWYIAFYALTIGVGLTARLILPEASNFDAELALPLMSQALLPKVLIGVVLAGIFSATMSTADSQILSCSAAFTMDIFPKGKSNLWITKLTTACVTVMALLIALYGSKNVFELVLISWSVLSAAFGPLLLLFAIGKRLTEASAIAVVLSGVIVTVIWRAIGLGGTMFEVAPGMIAGFLTYFVLSKLTEYVPKESEC